MNTHHYTIHDNYFLSYNTRAMKKEGDCINTLYLLSLMAKYGIEVVDYESGIVTVSIKMWKTYKHIFLPLISDLKTVDSIYSIDVNNTLVTIHYEERFWENNITMEQLYQLIKKYNV